MRIIAIRCSAKLDALLCAVEIALERAFPGLSIRVLRRDRNSHQYGPFGVLRLCLKRGLIEDLVFSTYATSLASQVKPVEELENLRAFETRRRAGTLLFLRSVDYTPERVRRVSTARRSRIYGAPKG